MDALVVTLGSSLGGAVGMIVWAVQASASGFPVVAGFWPYLGCLAGTLVALIYNNGIPLP